jgi:hypothetical protein
MSKYYKEGTFFKVSEDTKVYILIRYEKLLPEVRQINKSWKGFSYIIKKGECFKYERTNNWDASFFSLDCGAEFKIEAGNPKRWIDEDAKATPVKRNFVTNKGHYYFIVEGELNTQELKNCIIHPSLKAMHKHVAEAWNLDIDQVEGYDYLIKQKTSWCERGFPEKIKTSIEEYINNFTM